MKETDQHRVDISCSFIQLSIQLINKDSWNIDSLTLFLVPGDKKEGDIICKQFMACLNKGPAHAL